MQTLPEPSHSFRRWRALTLIAGLAWSLGACGDSPPRPRREGDAGENTSDGGERPVGDAGDRDDAGSGNDAGDSMQGHDAGSTDGGALTPGCLGDVEPEACSTDADCSARYSMCLRGTCVHRCGGATKEELDESLGEALEVLGSFCSPEYSAEQVLVSETDGCEQAKALYLAGGNIGDDTFNWLLWEQVLDPTRASPPLIERMSGTVTRPGGGTSNFADGFRLSLDGQTAYFTIYDSTTMTGELYRQRIGEAGAEVALADSGWLKTFDWLDEGILLRPAARMDGAIVRFSLDAIPLDHPEGRKIVVEPGKNSIISIAVLRKEGIVLLGGGSGGQPQVHAMTLADLRAAYENDDPIVLYSDARATSFDLNPQFWVVGDELMLTRDGDTTMARRIQIDGSSVTFGEAFPLKYGLPYSGVIGLGKGRLMFIHFTGTIYARLKASE